MKKPYRKRYIVLEIISNSEITQDLVEKAILQSMKRLFGDIGVSEARPKLLKDLSKNKKHVLQLDHRYVQKTKLAMALIKEINKKNVIFKTVKVYGTLKKIKK